MSRVNERLDGRIAQPSTKFVPESNQLEKHHVGHERLTRIYRDAPVGLCCLDTQLRYLDINEWLSKLNGLSVEEHLGHSIRELFPELADGVESQLRHVLDTGKPILDGSVFVEMPAKPNEIRYFSHNFTAVKSDDGMIVGVSCVVEEISERKKAEQSLKHARDGLKERTEELQDINRRLSEEIEVQKKTDKEMMLSVEIIENMAAGVALIRVSDGILIFSNPKFDEIFGYEKDELVGKHVSYLNATGDQSPQETAELMINELIEKRIWSGEINNIHKDGSQLWTHTSVSTFQHPKFGEVWVMVLNEISQRKKSEHTLFNSEKRLRDIFDSMFGFIGLCTTDGILIEANSAPLEAAGLKKEDVIGKPFSDTYWWSYSVEAQEQLKDALRSAAKGETVRYDVPIRMADDQLIEIDVMFGPLYDSQGNISQLLGFAVDITHRKRVEDALRLSEERLDLAVRGTSDGLWDWNINTGIEYWSPRFKELLGYKEHEIEATFETFLSLLHPDDQQRTDQAIQAHFEKYIPYDIEFRLRQKNGEYRWFCSRGEATRDENGKPIRMAGSIRDVTDRKQEEDALQALVKISTRQYSDSFFESMALELARVLQADYIFIGEVKKYKTNSIRTIASVAESELVDDIEYDLVGTPCEQVLAGSVCSYASNVADQFPKDAQLKEMSVEGYVGVRLLSSTCAPLGILTAMYRSPLANTEFAETMLQIYSARVASEIERKRSEEETRFHIEALAHVNRVSAMGEMASGLAHELNQPLTAISLFAETCMLNSKSIAGDDPVMTSILEKIREQSIRAGEIIRSLRKFVNKSVAYTGTIRISEIIDNVLMLLESELKDDGVTVVVHISDGLPSLRGDTIQLQQVVLNLIHNACEAMREDNADKREIALRASTAESGVVEITVKDTGPGMSEELMGQAFDTFFTTKTDGMGMGLAICRTIIESHGGKISVSSNPDCGVTFCIALPEVIEENHDES